eukprot:g10802.t2
MFALARMNRADIISKALEVLNGSDTDVRTYTMGISACARFKLWQEALALLESKRDTAQAHGLDTAAFNATLSACNAAERWRHALELFDSGMGRRWTVDVISFNTMISACGKGKQGLQALSLFEAMPDRQVSPDVISYNATMSACSKSQLWEHALRLFESITDAKIQPSLVSVNAAITSCAQGVQWEKAVIAGGISHSHASLQCVRLSLPPHWAFLQIMFGLPQLQLWHFGRLPFSTSFFSLPLYAGICGCGGRHVRKVFLALSLLVFSSQGWWKEEYFLTRDAAHAQVFKLSLASRLRALGCGALSALSRNEAMSRTAAATKLHLTELDVQFMLLHMYQVTFANEESAWTRKRNADFLALQLKVQQAITASYSELVSQPSIRSRFWIFFLQFQPHRAVQSYSLVLFFLVVGDTQPRNDESCKAAGSRQYVEGVVGGLGLQLLFSCISRLLQLLWTGILLLFHSREFKQDVQWDAESRRQQVTKWWLQDVAFAALILLYSFGCCMLGTAYVASASDEDDDGQRWLASFATMVFLTVLVEPLAKSLDLDPIREVEEVPGAPDCPVPLRSPSAPALKGNTAKEPDISPVGSAGLSGAGPPTIHAWRRSFWESPWAARHLETQVRATRRPGRGVGIHEHP